MPTLLFGSGHIVLEDRILSGGQVEVHNGRIRAVGSGPEGTSVAGIRVIDLEGGLLLPGFVDLHVHGGDGADFMDGTEAAFRTVCRAHARHGTTSLLPTSTVARPEQVVAFLKLCRQFKNRPVHGARVLGAHLYGPYFAREARGCHPADPVRAPHPSEYKHFLEFADSIVRATVAPELPGAEEFVRSCRQLGIACNAGHSHATFAEMEAAVSWGVSHVDHLFCAMSDRARLRQTQPFPMRGGVLEATLYFDQLTTEVIADGRHLSRELLLLAHKIKGPDRLALVTDCNRALDMPDGPYIFGPCDGGEPFLRRDGVGVMPDGQALASGVMGMDHALRTLLKLTGLPLHEAVRMASLTPARIAGADREIGSIAPGKLGDLLVMNANLEVQKVYSAGAEVWPGA
jgi:N-acetylglucosamine-6-phosphate deacetylase